MVGDGPSPSGFNDDLSMPNWSLRCRLCNHKSIVRTPDGLMFQSAKGIYLMDRSLEVLNTSVTLLGNLIHCHFI